MIAPQYDPPPQWLAENKPWLDRAAAHWSARWPEVMTVRAWLSSPIAWDGYATIQLEGALQAAVIYLETGRTPDEVYAGIGDGFHPPRIPVAIVRFGPDEGRPIHLASAGIPPKVAVESIRWRRKRARVDVLGIPGRITVAGGWAKGLNLPVATLTTPWLDFHVFADRERLARLLKEVRGLGRDCTRGLGSVLGCEILECARPSVVMDRGAPLRPLPVVQDGDDAFVVIAGHWKRVDLSRCEIRPCATMAPYWHRASVELCASPIVRGLSDLSEREAA